jgi:hypothetical protein
MTIVRYEAGTEVPRDAQYSLVGHYGGPRGFVTWCEAGEPFPPPPEGHLAGSLLWYVEVAVTEAAVTLIAA